MLLSLTVGITITASNEEFARQSSIQAEARALTALNYRKMVSDYLAANPGTPDGVIAAADLLPFAARGYTPDNQWQHRIESGRAIIYSTGTHIQGIGRLLSDNHDTCLIGRNQSGTFVSSACGTGSVPLTLHTSIPNGATVILGNG
jgi:hypothetical protein